MISVTTSPAVHYGHFFWSEFAGGHFGRVVHPGVFRSWNRHGSATVWTTTMRRHGGFCDHFQASSAGTEKSYETVRFLGAVQRLFFRRADPNSNPRPAPMAQDFDGIGPGSRLKQHFISAPAFDF
jgi:hypothetical protein